MAVPMSSATARVSTTSGSTKYSSRLPTLPGFKVTSCLTVVLLICLETVLLCTVSNCAKSFYVHWNTTNSIFRIDNTDHIIDVNKGNLKFEYDQVNIICPVYTSGHDEDAEKYIIYNVSKEEYETCRITNPNPRIIAICDKPYKLMYFTITFRPFTPQPGGLEFLPGNDYYFISTSSRDDLHRRIGGRCTSHNMKVVFKVCCSPEQSTSHLPNTSLVPGRGPVYFSSTSATSLSWPAWPITSTSHHPPPTTIQIATTQKTLRPYVKTTKKNNEYDKHANEVVKNEELTYKSGVPLWRLNFHSAAGLWLFLCTLLPLLIARWR